MIQIVFMALCLAAPKIVDWADKCRKEIDNPLNR